MSRDLKYNGMDVHFVAGQRKQNVSRTSTNSTTKAQISDGSRLHNQNYCSYAPMLICPFALTRGFPAKSNIPTTVGPGLVPAFTTGNEDATSRFGGSVDMLSN